MHSLASESFILDLDITDFSSMEDQSDVNPALNQALLWSPTLASTTDSSMAIPGDIDLGQPVDASEEIRMTSTDLDAGSLFTFVTSIPVFAPNDLRLMADVINLSLVHLSQEQICALNASVKF